MSVFEHGLIERLQAQYPSVDVRALAADCQDQIRRKGNVRRPDGLLVAKVRKAALAATHVRSTVSEDEQIRYAKFQVELFRRLANGASVHGYVTPDDLADMLENARDHDFPRLNAHVTRLLRDLGSW